MAGMIIDSEYFKKIITTAILFVLLVLSFLVLRPILLSIIMGMILAVVCSPPYDWILKKTKSKWFSITSICLFLAAIIIVPFWFLVPIFIKQSFEVYLAVQKIDFIKIFGGFFPNLSQEFLHSEFSSILNSFVPQMINSMISSFSQLILNFPSIFLQFIVVLATFFFVLKDKDEILSYLHSLMPFSKEVERKLFQSSTDITLSVVYGQILIGFIQGVITGIGFFIFGIPNALFLTLFAIFAGILPLIGPTIVWIPVVIYLFVAGNTSAAVGITLFGLISTIIDYLIRPILVSKKSKMHPLLSLTGMIGGFFFFGILGFILGPLILAYVIIILEIYRGKELHGFFVKNE
ncbi:MAG TPA: AI-2E family transporter [Candidatus Nanoarchaeia archaeon]|nr:AI-2E family transporter [Candidatus Nanoarchaeia archaeon]